MRPRYIRVFGWTVGVGIARPDQDVIVSIMDSEGEQIEYCEGCAAPATHHDDDCNPICSSCLEEAIALAEDE